MKKKNKNKRLFVSLMVFTFIVFVTMSYLIITLLMDKNEKDVVFKEFVGIGLDVAVNEQVAEKKNSKEDFVKSNFMEGCLSEANYQYDYCNCTYDYMLDNMEFEDFVRQSAEYELTDVLNEEIEKNMIDAMVECLVEYDY